MKTIFFKTDEAVASNCGAMEADTISKHGGSSKSQMSRGNIMQRTFLFFAVFCFSVESTFAQDVIKMENGREIKAIVQETVKDDVMFQKHDNPDGTVYTLKKYEIATIIYADGRKEDYSKVVPPKLPKFSPAKLNIKYTSMTKNFYQDFDNRMSICGFTERIVVYDFLTDEDKKWKASGLLDIGWCTVGIWINRQAKLVALRLKNDNWNEIIIPFDNNNIQSVKSNVYGYTQTTGIGFDLGGIDVVRTKTRERFQGLRMRIVTGNINTGTKSYTLIIYDKWPSRYLDGTEDMYDSILECAMTIEDEIDLIIANAGK